LLVLYLPCFGAGGRERSINNSPLPTQKRLQRYDFFLDYQSIIIKKTVHFNISRCLSVIYLQYFFNPDAVRGVFGEDFFV